MTPRARPGSAWVPVAAMLGSIISLSVGSSYAKTLFPLLGAQGTTAIRLAFAAVMLCAFWQPWKRPLSGRDARVIALYGAVLGTMNLLFYLAIARIPLGLAVAIEFTGPLVLAMASSRRALDFVWIAFAALGLGLLLPLGHSASPLDPLGMAFALGAGVCWALYIVTGKRAGDLHGGQATSLGLLTAALLVLPLGIGSAIQVFHNPPLLLSSLVVGLLSSALPYSLEMMALKRLPQQTFGILLSMEPAVGALAALAMLHEVLSASQWGAIACIMGASVGSATTVKPPPPLPPT